MEQAERRQGISLSEPIGALVGTIVIGTKREDVPLIENFSIGTRLVLVSPSIRCGASDHTMITYAGREIS
jgi:hypothetical protein